MLKDQILIYFNFVGNILLKFSKTLLFTDKTVQTGNSGRWRCSPFRLTQERKGRIVNAGGGVMEESVGGKRSGIMGK